MSEIDKKNLIEEIANKVVNKIDELEYNTEISNSELWKDLINPNEMDFDELFELNNRIIDLCENKEYMLNFDKYEGADVGLPYSIPFIKEKKGEQKEIVSFTIQYGNYLHIDSFNFFGYGENIKCGVEEIGKLYKRDKKNEYVKLLPEDGYVITNIAKNILNKKEVVYEPLEGGAVYSIEFIFDNGTEKRISFTEDEELCNKIKEMISRSTLINLENILIQLSIYYFISTRDAETETTLKECCDLLKEEEKYAIEGKTLFNVKDKVEHIINKLYDNIKGLNYARYSELLEKTILKMNYYYNTSKDNSIMSTESEKDVEEISYNILNFNIGTDELIEKEDSYAKYELGERYFYCGLDEKAYKYFEIASEQGHKLATYKKILCIYKGYGTEKDENKAFIELSKFVENRVCTKARVLLGEMYYFGKGTEKDYKKAYECFVEAEYAEENAKFYLAEMYMNGYGIEKNEEKAKELLKQAVDKKNTKAIKYVIENNIKL